MAVVFWKEEQVNLLLSGHNLNNSTNLEPQFTNEAHTLDEEVLARATGLRKCLPKVCKSQILYIRFHKRTDVAV